MIGRIVATLALLAPANALILASLGAGLPAPKWSVKAHTGETMSSDGLKGSKYIIWFYPKADTGG